MSTENNKNCKMSLGDNESRPKQWQEVKDQISEVVEVALRNKEGADQAKVSSELR